MNLQIETPHRPRAYATCKYCGSDRGFREFGEVRATVHRDSTRVRLADGKVRATWDSLDTFDADFDMAFDPNYVVCRNCDAEEASIEDLLGEPVVFEPGERVVLPDGFLATVATVDEESRTLTVVNWHETFKFGEVGR